MPRNRTAEDQVLALLARVGSPLEREEIAELLSWSRQRAGAVLREIPPERMTVTEGAARDRPGRRPRLFSLPGMEPAKPAPDARAPHFEPYTIVVAPSGREARVIAMRANGFAEIEYLHVRAGEEPRATVRAKLLREIQAGRERPDPFRVTPDTTPV